MRRGFIACTGCGRENADPGEANLASFRCGYCKKPTLVRIPTVASTRGEIIFFCCSWAVIGGGVAGSLAKTVVGVVLGLLLGAAVGAFQGVYGERRSAS